jgi:hypothetical protein
MLGFNIINNSGLAYLENMLYRNTPNGRSLLKSKLDLAKRMFNYWNKVVDLFYYYYF